MRRFVRYRILLACLNLAAFSILGLQEHVASISSPRSVSSPVEYFACVPLERSTITEEEREWYSYISGECRATVPERLVILPNLPAFAFGAGLMRIAPHLGVTNQVVLFYASMPVAIFAWWYLFGTLARPVITRKRSQPTTECAQRSGYTPIL